MTFTYRYRELPGKMGAKIRTPSIPITFKGNSPTTLKAVALVDSGADCSVIPKGLAEVLNVTLTGPKQDSFGFGGKIVCIESKISISLKQGHEHEELIIPVLVNPNDNCPIILGRNTFFDSFKIIFDSKNQHLSLKKNKKSTF